MSLLLHGLNSIPKPLSTNSDSFSSLIVFLRMDIFTLKDMASWQAAIALVMAQN